MKIYKIRNKTSGLFATKMTDIQCQTLLWDSVGALFFSKPSVKQHFTVVAKSGQWAINYISKEEIAALIEDYLQQAEIVEYDLTETNKYEYRELIAKK